MKKDEKVIVSDEHKKVVVDFASAVRTHMNLNEWDADIFFGDFENFHETNRTLAEIEIQENYLTCAIKINEEILAEIIRDENTEKLRLAIIHEFCHIIIDPLYFIAVDAQTNATMRYLEKERERAVCRVSQMVAKSFDDIICFIE